MQVLVAMVYLGSVVITENDGQRKVLMMLFYREKTQLMGGCFCVSSPLNPTAEDKSGVEW